MQTAESDYRRIREPMYTMLHRHARLTPHKCAPNQPFVQNRGFDVMYNIITIMSLFFKNLDIVRVLADLRNIVLVDLVSLPACNAQNEVVEGRTAKNIDVIT